MSKTRFVSIVTVVEVQASSNDAALKLARRYVDISTGPGDIVNVVENKTRFYDITEDYIFYELYDAEEVEEYEEYEDYIETEDQGVSDGTTTSDYVPLINFDEDKFDDDGGRTYFDADEELRLLKLEIEEEAEVDKAVISALDQAHKDTKEYQENGRTYFDVDEELRLVQEEAEVDGSITSALTQTYETAMRELGDKNYQKNAE